MQSNPDTLSTVDLNGLTDFRYVTQAHEKILTAIQSMHDGCLTLSVPADADVDLSFVQLLYAAQKMATQRKIRLMLDAPATGNFLNTLRRGGFLNTNSNDFWLEKSED